MKPNSAGPSRSQWRLKNNQPRVSTAPIIAKPKSGKGGTILFVWNMIAANGFGLLLTLFIFGILPALQIVTGGAKKNLLVRTVTAITEAPPQQDSLLEEPPPPPDTQDEPPPEMQQPLMSLADISGALNPSGTGAAVLQNVMSSAVASQAMSAFAMGGDEIKPRPISTAQPRLPTAAKRMNLRGTVKVQFTVDAQGRVQSPQIVSSANPALNQPVLDALKQWRFEPGTRGGRKVPFKMMQPFTF